MLRRGRLWHLAGMPVRTGQRLRIRRRPVRKSGGLPAAGTSCLLDLAAFKVGIEAFQVLLVCAIAPLLAYVRERTPTALSSLVHAARLMSWLASPHLIVAPILPPVIP